MYIYIYVYPGDPHLHARTEGSSPNPMAEGGNPGPKNGSFSVWPLLVFVLWPNLDLAVEAVSYNRCMVLATTVEHDSRNGSPAIKGPVGWLKEGPSKQQ